MAIIIIIFDILIIMRIRASAGIIACMDQDFITRTPNRYT